MRADQSGVSEEGRERGWSWPLGGQYWAGVVIGAGVLAVAYLATLAPGLTFWDAGEFITAVHSFGIPHPPGTPLYIVIARVWLGLLPALNAAAAVNLLSAVATVAACCIGGVLVASALESGARSTRNPGTAAVGIAAVVASGTMSTVWLNATESEVYALSLLLSALMLLAAYQAARSERGSWLLLIGYLFALSSPLHLGAVVAAPAAIVLAASGATGFRVERVVLLSAAACAAAATSLGSPLLAAAAVIGLAAAPLIPGARRAPRARLSMAMAIIILVALSAQLILLARASHDPAINQGNASTLEALVGVITREQYAVAPLWPRQAPLWIQFGNFLEYVDWQVALGLAPGVAPSPWRTPFTLLFLALGARGARLHREHDPRTWRAMAVLLFSASVGVIVQLNLKAGPSFGYGILPDDAPHEARERDYFFALAFWAWGLWAGAGAVAAACDLWRRVQSRIRWAPAAGVAAAALPLVLNWRAVDRSAVPDAELPRTFALAILESAPANAVLFTWGDNDTYPLWYLQEVEGLRRDVTLVTVPLLPADWYRAEVARRTGLLDSAGSWHGQTVILRRIAHAARDAGRPVAVVITMPADERSAIGASWSMHGLVYVSVDTSIALVSIDSIATQRAAERVGFITAGPPIRVSTDPTGRYVRSLLACPSAALAAKGLQEAVNSLAPVCNLR